MGREPKLIWHEHLVSTIIYYIGGMEL